MEKNFKDCWNMLQRVAVECNEILSVEETRRTREKEEENKQRN
jgi:hypothetical protein